MTEHTKISQPYRIKLQGSGYYPFFSTYEPSEHRNDAVLRVGRFA